MSFVPYWLPTAGSLCLLVSLYITRRRMQWYRARYLAEQRSTGQLHEAIFHLRQHLEKAQKEAAGRGEAAA